MMITHLSVDDAQQAMINWQLDQPARFRAHFSTVADQEDSVHLGIFDDNHLLSVVTLQLRAPGTYEVHLSVRKGAGVAELLPAFLSIRQQLFGELGVREISGWVPRLHAGIRRLAQQVGFRESGAALLKVTNGRLSEEVQVVLAHG